MPQADPHAVLRGKRLLIVEDEPLIALELEEMVAELGATLAGSVAQIAEALALIEAGSVDAAVLDVNLGRQKVDPVAAALAARGSPFVFTTGYGRVGVPSAYNDHAVVEKPFSRTDVADALAAEIRRFGSR